ncbi:DUF5801 repeats-in-toxin domain-containing protein [Sphingomonas sp. LY160]|uniref:DUF5801 repeats-in-toxin domain-containing protein n=1 Tax=Sphingomonas sp. LY160 TaxID=3095342 RepID=UPI002ADEEDB3|nr:DUF5801 repeats-in-toxin domain-containing protein [Sphingomonas sp. LY160]MEA1072707.1 DUF5801 repeats-in-toxin domain-containing protein [Sphingomonas sp. LY160]
MRYEDSSQAVGQSNDDQGQSPIARDDNDALAAGDRGPATGNIITGEGAQSGSLGADVTGGDARITAVRGAGGEDSNPAGGGFNVNGEFGKLSLDANGNYQYTPKAGTPENSRDVFTYTLADRQGNSDTATLTVEIGKTQAQVQANARQVVVGPDGTVILPAGVELSDIMVVGRNLVVTLPDGSQMVIIDGAVFVPQLVLDGVEVPATNLATLLIGQEVQPAAGFQPTQSSGGNFAEVVRPLDPGVPLGDLLPPTEMTYTPPEVREIYDALDREPDVVIQTPDQPVGVENATASVNENALPARSGEPAGSNSASTAETTVGTIVIDSPDSPSVVTINGIAVTGVGQVIAGTYGSLTITSTSSGAIGYSYTLADNTTGDATQDLFTVVLTDRDGDTDTATLTVSIIDDVPTARPDTDSVAAGSYALATGNVITDAAAGDLGDGDTNAADTVGADNATVSLVSGAGGSDSSFDASGNLVVNGQYGVLTIKADGSYSYARNPNSPGGVNDVFNYTLTDGDGDTSSSTLTISIGDTAPTLRVPATGAGTQVSEAGLPIRGTEPAGSDEAADGNGSDNDVDSETTAGTINFTQGDAPATVAINGIAVTTVGQTFVVTGVGVLTITSIAPGAIGYSFTLTDNTSGDATSVSFAVSVTDADGDVANDNLVIRIIDDVPNANDDSVTQATENTPVTINVFANDVPGADGVDVDNNPAVVVNLVAGSLSGSGTLVYNNDGTFTYTPGAGEEGIVTFQYRIVDGDGDSDVATVTIQLQPDSIPLVLVAQGSDTIVHEAGLPSRNGEPAGTGEAADGDSTDNDDPRELAAGTLIVTTGTDTVASLVVLDAGGNAVNVTNGGVVQGAYGTLTISGNAIAGYTYSYVLNDNTSGDATSENFGITVTDSDGDTSSTNLIITIVDDAPIAVNDTDSIAAGSYGPAVGNVITDAEGDGGKDNVGADNATVSGIASNNVPANSDTSFTAGNLVVNGQYGVLTIAADGSYSYVRNAGTPGGVSDVFTYTLTDGDGDSTNATLTISIADSGVTLDAPDQGEAGTVVSEVGLPTRNGGEPAGTGEAADGNSTDNDDGSETTTGVIAFNAPDGPATVTIDGVAVTGTVGQTFVGAFGTLTITSYNAATGQIGYSYTLADNTSGDATFDDFAIQITDQDGDVASDTLVIQIIDDAPIAIDDVDSVGEDSQTAADGNVLTGIGGTDGNATDGVRDNVGADNAVVSAVAFGATVGALGAPLAGAYGQLVLNANGSYSYVVNTGLPAVQGLDDGETLTEVFTYTIVDGDGDVDTATLTITINGANDAPVAVSSAVTVSEEGLPGGNPDTTGAPTDTTNSATASGVITISDADGEPLTVTLGIPAGAYTSDGVPVTWALSGNGQVLTGSAGGVPVVTVTIDNTGAYTVVLSGPLDHANAAVEDLAGIVIPVSVSDGTVTTPATITLTVEDDSPLVTRSTTGLPTLNVDETNLVQNATASFANAFSVSYGGDGAGSLAYTLSISAAGTNSGLIDTATGQAILLYVTAGGVVEGRVGSAAGPIAFAVGVDASGNVTLDQIRAVFHDPNLSANDVEGLSAANLVTLTATAIDADGDSESETIAIGGQLTFTDDGPAITTSVTDGNTVTLTTQDAETDGVPTDQDVATSTANFGGAFGITSSSYGADGAGTTSWNFNFTVASGVSGLSSNGAAINLYLIGGVVVGSTAGSAGAVTAGNTIFTIGVNATSGVVTLTQFAEIDHALPGSGSNYDAQLALLGNGLVILNGTATIVDKDGDSATSTQSLDLGGNIRFADDGPAVTPTGAPVPVLNVDETNLALNASGSFAGLFTIAYGADGPGTTAYALGVSAAGANSGLIDTATGQAILLYVNGSGVVEGRVGSALGAIAFTVSVDAAGTVTLDQIRAVIHDPNVTANDVEGLAAANLVTLTATVTDGDGDVDSETVNIGGGLTFTDDGPTISAVAAPDALQVDETNLALNATANFADNFTSAYGADGAGTTVYSVTISATGANSGLIDTATGQAILLYVTAGGVVEGRVGSAAGPIAFAVGVDALGNVTLDQLRAIVHTPDTGPDQVATLSAANLISVVATITDKDGDVASSSIGIGNAISFRDDGPSATNDSDAIAVGSNGPATGNVLTGVEVAVAEDGNASDGNADAPGADGGRISFIDNSLNAAPGVAVPAGGSTTIAGQFGTLTIFANGDYSYARTPGAGGGQNEVFTYTLTDGDGDSATATLTISIGDNVPTAGNINVQLDDDALPGGNPNGTGDDPNSVNASGTLPGSGGDGALTFSVSTAGAPAGFTYVSGGAGVVLVQQSGTTVLTVTVNANGTYSVVQNAPIMHTAGGDENNATFTVNYTVTDADGDPAPGTITINVDDDTPIVNVTQTNEGGILLTTQDAETDGVPTAEDTAVSTANFGGVFQLSSSPGADGGTATPIAYTLAVTSAVSGLSSHGVAINLYNVGGVIYGSTALSPPAGASDPAVVFSIAVGSSGVVTLTQYQQIDHTVEGVTTSPFDDQFAILANGKITLTASSTLTDGDGDVTSDSEVIDLGGNIRFADDGPVAANDSVNQLTENAPITFNAFANDQFGADGVDIDNNPTVKVTFTQPAQGTVTYNPATGLFTFTPVPGQEGNPTFTYTITDFDGDTSTATVTLNLLADSTPTAANETATVDDDGLAGGNPGSTLGDLDANATEEAPINPSEAIYHGKFTATSGGDTIVNYTLAGMNGTTGTVGTETVTYSWNATDSVLTATGPRGALFDIIVNQSTGDYTVRLLDNVLHDPANAENDATAALTFRVTDSDGDFDDATLTITFDDDAPSLVSATNVTLDNDATPSGSGVFDYEIGADSRSAFSVSSKDIAVSLTGTVGSTAISNVVVNTGTITATTETFTFSFQYDADPLNASNPLTTATGSIVFNKAGGTYDVTLDQPIQSFQTNSTSGLLSTTGYNLEGSAAQSEIVVATLATGPNGLYVQFTGDSAGSTGTPLAGGNTAFANGETLLSTQSYVSISNAANGVAGDTIQRGEVLDFNFYSANPGGVKEPTPTTSATGMYLRFDGYGGEDLVVILKVADPNNIGGTQTTVAVRIDAADIFTASTGLPAGYTGLLALDNNDGLVVIEQNDYSAFVPAGYQIVGAQLISSTQDLTGTAINLNGATGAGGGTAAGSTQVFDANTVDTDVIKISDIGLVRTVTNSQSVSLDFQVTVTDTDGDSFVQNLLVNPPLTITNASLRTMEESRMAANTNTMVMASAIAAVGLAAPVAAEDLGDASSRTTTSITDMQVSKVAADDLDGNDGSVSINRLSTDTIEQSEAIVAQDGNGRSGDRGGDAATFDAAAGHAAGTPDHAANDVDQGPANDMSPASLVAPSIAMPSAEALASAGLAPESKVSGLVEKILADALAGNEHGQTVDALIDAAVGDAGQGAGHALASPMVEHVPAWDMGAGEAGAPIADMMFKMDAMQLHHDAVQPAVNG